MESNVVTVEELLDNLACLDGILSESGEIGVLENRVFELLAAAADECGKGDVMCQIVESANFGED